MEVFKNFIFKEMVTAEPGELLQLTIRGEAALAIVIRKNLQTLLLGVLKSGISDHPFVIELRGVNHMCISYGTQWVFEPFVGAETRTRNRAFVDVPGSLYMDGEDPILHFDAAPDEQIHGGFTCNLSTLQNSDVPQAAMPFARWKIWANSTEISGVGKSALFDNLTAL